MSASHRPATRRANNRGSVYRDAAGRLRGSITLPDPETKAPRRYYVTGRTKVEVEAKMDVLRQSNPGKASPAEKVGPFLTEWLEGSRRHVRPATYRANKTIIDKYLTPELGHIRLTALVKSDVERMTGNLIKRGLSPRTAIHARAVLRAALNSAIADGAVTRNAAKMARPEKFQPKEIAYLDPGQLRTLLDAVADHPHGPLVTVAATTGLRQGELLGLSWADVNFDGGTLNVRQQLGRAWMPDGSYAFALVPPKTTKSKRTISLPTRAVDALRRQRVRQAEARLAAGSAWQRGDLVFTNAVGQHLVGADVNAVFRRMLRDAGLPHIAFHGLRHSAATAMRSRGVGLEVVAAALGHTSIALVASTYGHILPEDLRSASEAMNEALS